MIHKPIGDIGLEDLQQLVTNKVAESRTLEYKQALPGTTDGEKKEFLADVSSFANAVGGDLLYGITEAREDGKTTGLPESADGLADLNGDAETRRLENILRDGVQPRLHGLQFQWVEGLPNGPVLIIRVPRSWAGPHMVTYQQHSRFYARNASGKNALDVFELRQAFLGSGFITERAREFRAERVGRVVAGETPVALDGEHLVCVHFIPHAALAGGSDIDLQLAATQHNHLQPFCADIMGSLTFNLDGIVTYRPSGGGSNMSYLQVFRNGVLESATSSLMAGWEGGLRLNARALALELGGFLNRARELMKALDINPPASLYVSLLGVRGATLGISENRRFLDGLKSKPFDRDNLLVRELFLIDWDGDVMTTLKPLLNELWQSSGFARCLDYTDAGEWKPHR